MATYTLESVEQSMLDNIDFEEVGSVTKAKAFVSAANRWFILAPTSESNQSSSLAFDQSRVENVLKRAHAYIAANGTNSNGAVKNVRFLDVSNWSR